ncbi:MAG: protein kinase [Bacillota bacterium]
MRIGDYELTSPFVTAGSGNARWCVAIKDGKRYFLKQFLAPVQPVQTTVTATQPVQKRRSRCAAFERRKRALYDALLRIRADCIVHVEDFFVHDGHYFAASEWIDPSHPTFETVHQMQPQTVCKLLYSLAECLRTLHRHGVVHADLKPEHIIVGEDWTHGVRLIDFDAGFLETSPTDLGGNIEVDPAYLSPEAYLLMTGKTVKLNRKLDTFALGIVMHQALTGEMPRFDKEKFAYLYACVLDGGWVALSPKLQPGHRLLIRRMLRKNPAFRPSDRMICKALKKTFDQD